MSKRTAVEDALGESPLKKLHLDHADIDYMEDDETTAHTPGSTTIDIESPITTVSTPRAKFPSDLKTLACTWEGCAKTFNRPARLRDHLNSHTNSRPFKCPYDDCDKDYTVDKHLKQHIKAVHTQERKHVCQRPGCGKSFVTGTRLKRHQAVHEGADRFRCHDCGQSFRKKDTLNKHARKEHQGLPTHPCTEPGCSKAFDTKASLKRHRERDHGEAKFWCDECSVKVLEDGTEERAGFTTEVLLQAHIKQEHQNCMFCDFKSSTQGELERHTEMYHSGKSIEDRRTELCPYEGCNKKFTNRSNCNNHIRTAHEGFRYTCGETTPSGPDFDGWSNTQGCGDKFRAKARLEDHIRYIHLGQERPKMSVPLAEAKPEAFFDDIAGILPPSKADIPCPHCTDLFIRYADLDTHVERFHPPDTTLASFLEQDPGQSIMFPLAEEDLILSAWPEDMPQEEIFAAEMDYGPQHDEWAEDEANIMLLARDPPELNGAIDPTLDYL